jgi:SAM-dependent methyltransferase
LKSDREKWDARYSKEETEVLEPDPFLVHHEHLLTGGRALDLACGLGANALFLARHGYQVDAIDISYVALARLHREAARHFVDLQAIVADLEYFPLPADRYDLIVVFYFYAPALVPSIKASLKKGGLLFYATYNWRHTSLKPGFNRDFLVPPGGLISHYCDFEILWIESEAGEHGNVARLIGRRR